MARAAREQLGLYQVIFMPTGSPHYRAPAVASGEHRTRMLELGLQDDLRFRIDTSELADTASGYTVDTLERLKKERPTDELYLLMGADQYSKFESWREPARIAQLARLAVFARPGHPVEGAAVVQMPPMDISATAVRDRVARGQSIEHLVPAPVRKYIMEHKLYH